MTKRIHIAAMAALLGWGGTWSCVGYAADDSAAQQDQILAQRQHLLQIIKEVENDPPRRAEAVAAGEERTRLCSNCHGEDGNSKQPDIPNLAGQSPTYLLEQIEHFASGRRKNFVMNSLTKEFTLSDKVNLAIFYSSMTVKPTAFDAALAPRGKQIFERVCYLCHGSNGKGEEGFARIAGQKPAYVIKTLKRYRANALGQTDPDEVKRTNPRMEQVTQSFTDRDIEAVANYVTSLH